MNFEDPYCLTLFWCVPIHSFSLSIESRRLFQSEIMQLFITALNSSISCGSIGLDTEAFLFFMGVVAVAGA